MRQIDDLMSVLNTKYLVLLSVQEVLGVRSTYYKTTK